jgi:hypothetical protein
LKCFEPSLISVSYRTSKNNTFIRFSESGHNDRWDRSVKIDVLAAKLFAPSSAKQKKTQIQFFLNSLTFEQPRRELSRDDAVVAKAQNSYCHLTPSLPVKLA